MPRRDRSSGSIRRLRLEPCHPRACCSGQIGSCCLLLDLLNGFPVILVVAQSDFRSLPGRYRLFSCLKRSEFNCGAFLMNFRPPSIPLGIPVHAKKPTSAHTARPKVP
ncbi:hypothetical protein CBM2586_B10237 [Cupriavidus phytorum]|uniref:Uncharacterized protein n=1 Tax=Cupriavidus taiwanensis TaxID=164546 RepID=A0A375C962_9BURK|nr:hypothetical protein CBM2586_B10237 [Cupriavidus taiwanensis]